MTDLQFATIHVDVGKLLGDGSTSRQLDASSQAVIRCDALIGGIGRRGAVAVRTDTDRGIRYVGPFPIALVDGVGSVQVPLSTQPAIVNGGFTYTVDFNVTDAAGPVGLPDITFEALTADVYLDAVAPATPAGGSVPGVSAAAVQSMLDDFRASLDSVYGTSKTVSSVVTS